MKEKKDRKDKDNRITGVRKAEENRPALSGQNADNGAIEERKIRIEPKPTENKYYLKISRRFRAARFATILALIVFVLAMLTVFGSEITIENFKYLMKYLDINVITSPNEFQTVGYESGSEMSFGFYKGDFVVLTENGLSMYDQMATQSVESPLTMSSPTLAVSDKYILAYDRGGMGYSLFNSFSSLYSGTMEYPIYTADVCDSGRYVIVSRNLSYLSAIYVYDQNFNMIAQLQKDKYVMSIDLSDDGERLLILSVYGNDSGQFCGELQVFHISDATIEAERVFVDALPIKAVFNGSGISVMISDRFSFFNNALEPVGTDAPFDASAASLYTMGKQFCAIATSENVIGYQSSVTMFGNSGELLASFRVSGQLIKMISAGERFYLLTTNRLYRGGSDGIIDYVEIEKDGIDIITDTDQKMIFVCCSNRAFTVSFDKNEESEAGNKSNEQR